MNKIIVGKNTIIFINIMSLIVALFSLITALTLDVEMLYLLFLSLFLTLLSLLFLINRIEYNENIIKFKFVLKKFESTFDDIKEIFLVNQGITGYNVVFNFETNIEGEIYSYFEYIKKCKNLNCFFVSGVSKKDLNKFLKNYKGRILGD